ncbi:lysine exporter LysO family protein [Emergencia sp.]|uniref:lysine exporter LysO family protein n=1 Tax=Emergencia sp. TaxID=1926557 RepID=UPI003AEF6BBC
MSDLILYLIMAVIGYFFGSKLRHQKQITKLTGRIQTIAIIVLIFTMGMRMGSNEEVMNNLNSIGFSAFIMTIMIIFCSVTAITISRKFLKIDRFGNIEGSQVDFDEVEEEEEKAEKDSSMTIIIIVCVVSGLVFGYFAVDKLFTDMEFFNTLSGNFITIGLCILLFFVGFDMGFEGTVIGHLKRVGLRVLAFPFIIMVGTLAGALLCSFFLPLSVKESLAVGAGFGWYTLAPSIIMDKGLVTASAVSFMHNIMREYISVLIIPMTAKKAGYLEAVAVSGCSSMDVCLPIVEKATRGDIAMYSFISGVVQSLAVPILVPLILG